MRERRFRSPSRSRSPPPRRHRSPPDPRYIWREFEEPELEETEYKRLRDESRDRENKRRSTQTGHMQRSGNVKESSTRGGVVEDTGPKLFWDGFQWVTQAPNAEGNDSSVQNSTRKLRRLYFGNLPLNLGLTETGFQEVVWQEMLKRGMTQERSHCPIVCVWFAKDKSTITTGTYGFVEFMSVEDTDRALGLDGMEVLGVAIKVSRPNDYATTSLTANAGIPNLPPHMVDPSHSGSPFVILHSIILPEDLEADETWADALEDIEDGCKSYGGLRASMIVSDELHKSAPSHNSMVSVGDVVLEFETPAVADQCIQGMNGRKFNDRNVHCEKLSTDNFGLISPLVAIAKDMNIGIFRDNSGVQA